MSALNNLREKGTSLTMGENELLAERVRSYPRLYDKTCKEHKEGKNKGLKRKRETMVSWPISFLSSDALSQCEMHLAGPAYYMRNKNMTKFWAKLK